MAIVISVGLLRAQSLSVRLITPSHIENHKIHPSRLESWLSQILDEWRTQGYWSARLSLEKDSTAEGEYLQVQVVPGAEPQIVQLHFRGARITKPSTFERAFGMEERPLTSKDLPLIVRRLREQGLGDLEPVRIHSLGNNRYSVTYLVQNEKDLQFTGFLGYQGNTRSDSGRWLGRLQFQIPSLLGSGRSFSFRWERLRNNSEKVEVAYHDPWFFNTFWEAGILYQREVVGGQYLTILRAFTFGYPVNRHNLLEFAYRREQSILTPTGRSAHPQWQEQNRDLLGVHYRREWGGIADGNWGRFRAGFSRQLRLQPGVVQRLELALKTRLKIGTGWDLLLRQGATVQTGPDATTDPGLWQPLGGIGTVRGYAQEEVRGVSVGWSQQDLIWRPGNTAWHFFIDLGMISLPEGDSQRLWGYGMGAFFNTNSGLVDVSLAWHPGINLQGAFVHIVLREVAWWIGH